MQSGSRRRMRVVGVHAKLFEASVLLRELRVQDRPAAKLDLPASRLEGPR